MRRERAEREVAFSGEMRESSPERLVYADQFEAAAWPILRSRVAAALTITDRDAAATMRTLAAHGIVAGESGAAGLAGARVALGLREARERLGVDGSAVVATINTEGGTDRINYERVIRGASDR